MRDERRETRDERGDFQSSSLHRGPCTRVRVQTSKGSLPRGAVEGGEYRLGAHCQWALCQRAVLGESCHAGGVLPHHCFTVATPGESCHTERHLWNLSLAAQGISVPRQAHTSQRSTST